MDKRKSIEFFWVKMACKLLYRNFSKKRIPALTTLNVAWELRRQYERGQKVGRQHRTAIKDGMWY